MLLFELISPDAIVKKNAYENQAMTIHEALFHQKDNGRWEWLEPRNAYFLGPVDGSICTFETREEAAHDREQHLAAPVDNFGRRVRSRDAILKLLRIAASSEIGVHAATLEVVWHPRDQSGNNWNVESDESLDAIWDIVTLLQATYSIPERGEHRATSKPTDQVG